MRVGARDTTALTVGSAISGLLAYVFFALSTRSLGAVAAAPMSVLWTYWSFSGAAVTFPLQHWIARSVAADAEQSVRRALPRVAVAILAISGLAGGLAWLARNALFQRDDASFPLLVAGVTVGSGFIGVVRGGLSARNRFVSVAWSLVGENAVRCLGGFALLTAGIVAPAAFGLCLVAGALIGLAWPGSFRFGDRPGAAKAPSPLTFLGGVAGGSLIGQTVLTGGPVLLALSGGSPGDVTVMFACLALFRMPYTLALGLVSKLTGRLTSLVITGRHSALRRLRLLILVVTSVSTCAAVGFGAVAGPPLVRLVFGSQMHLPGSLAALIAAGSTVALANLIMTVSIMAQGRGGAVVRAWLVGILAGAAVFVADTESSPNRTAWAFVAAEVVGFGAALVEQIRGSGRAAGAPTGTVRTHD